MICILIALHGFRGQRILKAGKLTEKVLRLFIATGKDEVLSLVQALNIQHILTPVLPTSELFKILSNVYCIYSGSDKRFFSDFQISMYRVFFWNKTRLLVCEIACILYLARCLKQLSMIMKWTL